MTSIDLTSRFARWRPLLVQPNWYLHLLPEIKALVPLLIALPLEGQKRLKEELYAFFEKEIADGHAVFGTSGKNFDAERMPIDTVVIHHTENDTGITWQRINVIHLLRLYVPEFSRPSYEGDKEIQGKPLYSGHFRDGKQVFYAYHWLLRRDGTVERLLHDNEIGWHAGNWNINCRSAAICLDNDYTKERPSDRELTALVELIKKQYPQVSKENILGHREVNPKTSCPSDLFLPTAETRGWKADLFALL